MRGKELFSWKIDSFFECERIFGFKENYFLKKLGLSGKKQTFNSF
jgi:hypothetical protein